MEDELFRLLTIIQCLEHFEENVVYWNTGIGKRQKKNDVLDDDACWSI